MTGKNMLPAPPKMATFSLTIEEGERAKLMAFMSSDSWERAENVRHATIQKCTKNHEHCVRWAERDCDSSRVFAQFLASLYNGYRVKADVSDIGTLDPENFEHLMNVLRLCYMTQREPHTFIDNGSEVFERIISLWGMEKNLMTSTMTSSATSAIFSFNGTQIHTFADDNGETWFSAGDVCAVLGYSNDSEAIEKYCREKGIAKRDSHAEDEDQGLTYINEGNLYRLIINSRNEDAHAFEAKLTEEILPAIRKTGGCATPQDASALSPVQQNALWQIISQRSGNSDTVHADIWIRFNDHFEIGSYSELPAARFVDAVSFLAALSTNDALPGTRYQYPRAMLDQPHFVAPDDGKACLSLSMLSDLAQFESPLMSLLNQLCSDGHDISAPLDEAVAMRAAMQQTDKVLDEIRLIALKAKSGRLG